MLHWLGTKRGTQSYRNPHTSGDVVAKMSSIHNDHSKYGSVERFVDHKHSGKINSTKDEAGSWMSLGFKEGTTMVVDHYCLRHGDGNHYGCTHLRSWRLEGSNDEEEWKLRFRGFGLGLGWKVLKEHTNDQSLNSGYRVASWEVDRKEQGAGFRFFRIIQTGKNSNGRHVLCCAGIELYGTLFGM